MCVRHTDRILERTDKAAMAANIAAWFKLGQLHRVLGVCPGTSGQALKDACRRARLRWHPDKQNGDAATFRIVETSIQLLLNALPTFDSHIPKDFSGLIRMIKRCRAEFDLGTGGCVGELQHWRDVYLHKYKEYVRKQQEQQEVQETIRKIHEGMRQSGLRENLRKRCARKPVADRFPTSDIVDSHFLELKKEIQQSFETKV